jgi:hypothetical protein
MVPALEARDVCTSIRSFGEVTKQLRGIPATPSRQSKADGLWSFASVPSESVSAVLNHP